MEIEQIIFYMISNECKRIFSRNRDLRSFYNQKTIVSVTIINCLITLTEVIPTLRRV